MRRDDPGASCSERPSGNVSSARNARSRSSRSGEWRAREPGVEELLERKVGVPEELARAARAELESVDIVVVPAAVPRIVRDPDDDEVLAAAAEGEAQAIVTGDRNLLSLGAYQGITIVDPFEGLTAAGGEVCRSLSHPPDGSTMGGWRDAANPRVPSAS